MSSLAQEESRSISENCTWGKRKSMMDGKISMPWSRFLGYDKTSDGKIVINEEEAETVRKIYSLFLSGKSQSFIASFLEKEDIPSPSGRRKWYSTTVTSILTNEKYTEDVLLQKTYTSDFLTKKIKKNKGEKEQYFVKDSHPAIISKEVFDLVQHEMKKRSSSPLYSTSQNIFSGRVVCGECGSLFGSKVWHSTDRYRKTVWRCNEKYKGDRKCSTGHITDEAIKSAFVRELNKIY